ncbi:MAG: hypothetical protein HGN29_07225 [Asgard group archaeon]|nr:hypothetical protein [Asgard group archaeon]
MKFIIFILLLSVLISPLISINAESNFDFREIDFNNRGYEIEYEIIQGDNLDEMFVDLGFDIKGSFSTSIFNVILKNRKNEDRDIFMIESNKYISMRVPVFSMESYVILNKPLEIELNTTSELLKDFIGFNYQPINEETLHAELPSESSIVLPSLFTNITRPNFSALIQESNYLDFIPLILGKDYTRYEAEFTTLVLNQSFSINIFNEGYDEFTISLDMDIDPALSLKASWDKESGLLTSFSAHFTYGNKSSTLILSLKEVEEIKSPVEIPFSEFFISNSSSDYSMDFQKSSTENQLEDMVYWVTQLNQTVGLRYLFTRAGLEMDWEMYVYEERYDVYHRTSTDIHSTWLTFMPAALIPTWQRMNGLTILANALWTQLSDSFEGYQFTLSGVTTTLYTIQDVEFRMQYQEENSTHHLIWDISVDYVSNNTQVVVPKYSIQEYNLSMNGWLAYSQEGLLNGFSIEFHEDYNSYLQNITDLSIMEIEDDYYYNYLIESETEDITRPEFLVTEETAMFFGFKQIIFYSIFTYPIYRRIRKKRDFS